MPQKNLNSISFFLVSGRSERATWTRHERHFLPAALQLPNTRHSPGALSKYQIFNSKLKWIQINKDSVMEARRA